MKNITAIAAIALVFAAGSFNADAAGKKVNTVLVQCGQAISSLASASLIADGIKPDPNGQLAAAKDAEEGMCKSAYLDGMKAAAVGSDQTREQYELITIHAAVEGTDSTDGSADNESFLANIKPLVHALGGAWEAGRQYGLNR